MNPSTQGAEKGSAAEAAEKGDAEDAETAAVGAAADDAVAGGQQMLSPLSGAYLLVILGEPISEDHKEKMLEKLRKGKYVHRLHVFHISSVKVGAWMFPAAISARYQF